MVHKSTHQLEGIALGAQTLGTAESSVARCALKAIEIEVDNVRDEDQQRIDERRNNPHCGEP